MAKDVAANASKGGHRWGGANWAAMGAGVRAARERRFTGHESQRRIGRPGWLGGKRTALTPAVLR